MTSRLHGIRLGLCCLFKEEPIAFATRQATSIRRFPRAEQLAKLSESISRNGVSLHKAIAFCAAEGIGAFRINSRILPLKTHPEVGYALDDLPDAEAITALLRKAGALASDSGIRLSFHPDQFTLLSSPDQGVTDRSLAELAYHAEVADLVGADVIVLHGGGAYGDKSLALERLERALACLPEGVSSRLALENDDRIYTPADLLPVCKRSGIPFVYDVHHHRCNPDSLSVEDATDLSLLTWTREPLFHLSSPRNGWAADPRPHHDYIDMHDFPAAWLDRTLTVEIEAKAKELALRRLRHDLAALPHSD